MRRIALMNQKGGVGKTTTTVNLAAALARQGQRVCILDVDPQAHSTEHLGVRQDLEQPTLYDCLLKGTPLAQARRQVAENLFLAPSDINLAAAEVELVSVVGRELRVRELLEEDPTPFDYVLMDCPPSLGILTINALVAATEVLVPLQPHYLALHGLSKLFETVQLVARRLNPPLVISGIVLCLYETGTRLSAEVLSDLDAFLNKAHASSAQTPWSKAEIYSTRIRRNVRLAEAASFGKSIFDYDAASAGARDYDAFAREVIAQAPSLSSGHRGSLAKAS